MPHCHDSNPDSSTTEPTRASEHHHDAAEPTAADQTTAVRARRFLERRDSVLVLVAITLLVVGGSVAGYFLPLPGAERTLPEGAVVYFNAACGDCGPYMDMELRPALDAAGVPFVASYDYVNQRSYRAELNTLTENLGIPYELRGHLMVFVKDADRLLVLSGHVPAPVITDALSNASAPRFPRMLLKVSDGDMSDVTLYSAWAFTGTPWTANVGEPLTVYLDSVPGSGTGVRQSPGYLLPMVLGAGFVDGLNPCAFAVLLFFVSLLYVIRRPRIEVLQVGSVYIYGIFAVYFLIGIGLLGAVVISGDPHFMARVGSVLLIVLGGLTLLNAFVPAVPMPFRLHGRTWERIKPWMRRATVPAAGISGLLVGLCTFPCSGGIYVAVVGLIASQTAYLEGLAYLFLYNFMFILPLILILAVVSNKQLAQRTAAWERRNQRLVHVLAGIGMLALAGLVLLAIV